MRLPSIGRTSASARAVAARFPAAVVSALVAAVAGLWVVEGGTPSHTVIRGLVFGSLGIAGWIALAVGACYRNWPRPVTLVAHALFLGGLVWLSWLSPGWDDQVALRRIFQVALICHLAVAVLPYGPPTGANGFWQYNRTLLLRILIAMFYSAVLFLGLVLALLAIDRLFGVHIDIEFYARLFVLVVTLFNTLYFLAGVPDRPEPLESDTTYPIGLKVFSQYILTPLVTLYLAILTAYLAKVAITRSWPSGWIGWLVSGVAVAGILSLLLVHPLRTSERSGWIARYARSLFVALVPAVIMLLLAVGKRIAQYGVTEDRYFLLVLAIWLLGLSLFYAVSRSRNIGWIPWSLLVVAVLTLAGPTGAYSVSRHSQQARLEQLMDAEEPGRSERVHLREVSSVVEYLLERHGPGALTSVEAFEAAQDTLAWLETGTDPRTTSLQAQAEAAMSAVGLQYIDRWSRRAAMTRDFNAWTEMPSRLDVAGFDELLRVAGRGPISGAEGLHAVLDDPGHNLLVRNGMDTLAVLSLVGLIQELGLGDGGQITLRGSDPAPQVTTRAERVRARFVLQHINGVIEDDGPRVRGIGGDLLLEWPR